LEDKLATYDLVSTPFPKHDPFFIQDRPLQNKLSQLESYIEMKWDISEIIRYVNQIELSKDPELIHSIDTIHIPCAHEAMTITAILGYAKLFKSAYCRTVLDKKVFRSDVLKLFHKDVMDLRNMFLAHQVWNANKHWLHYHKGINGNPPKLNPAGYTVRIPVFMNLDLDSFKKLITTVEKHIEDKILLLCQDIESGLTPEQNEYLNSDLPKTENPFHKNPPYSSRSK
jgi:hypothetical protein